MPGFPEKELVHDYCLDVLAERISLLEGQLADLGESVANETKSTAGDKYETARAMLHIEQDQVRRQLQGLKAQQAVLRSVGAAQAPGTAALGSLVNLDGSWYYLSVALGRLQVPGGQVIAVSLQSPLGMKLRGTKAGAVIEQNDKRFRVLEII